MNSSKNTTQNPDPDLKGETSIVFSSSSQGQRKQGKKKRKKRNSGRREGC